MMRSSPPIPTEQTKRERDAYSERGRVAGGGGGEVESGKVSKWMRRVGSVPQESVLSCW